MAEDLLFEYLHSEIVAYCVSSKDDKESDLVNLEYIGFTTGYRIIERLTRDLRFKDELDTMKFICTEFWSTLYKKQIDNLRTNHQGIYVLQDNSFRLLTRLAQGSQYLEHAPKYVAFTCGLVRGSLANLGITSTVTAEISALPSCKFHIQVSRG